MSSPRWVTGLFILLIWGMVACAGRLESTPEPVDSAAHAGAALNDAMRYVQDRYGHMAPPADLVWQEKNITQPGLYGVTTMQYNVDSCQATVSFHWAEPEATIYLVSIHDTALGFEWAGEVNADGTVIETLVPAGGGVCRDETTGNALTYHKAFAIAQESECNQALFLPTRVCNTITGTWWLDLEMDAPGCFPACVVDVNTQTAVINWRCTGILDG